MTLAALLGEASCSRERLTEYVDGLGPEQRVAECVGLGRGDQMRLWEVTSSDLHRGGNLLSSGGDPETKVAVFAGRNSLGLFPRFEKRFARQEGKIFGYNKHALGSLIGPGYFGVESGVEAGRLHFDYRRIPSRAPEGWPAVVPNSRFPGRLVYGELLDEVVWLTPDFLVGSAFRGGAPLDSYFVLARTPLEV